MNIIRALLVLTMLLAASCKTTRKAGKGQPIETKTDSQMEKAPAPDIQLREILSESSTGLLSALYDPTLRIQIIYTQIDRTNSGNPNFSDHSFNLNDSDYFYPASTVKLPVAILALQKLNELRIAGLNKYTTMITEAAYSGQSEVYNDPTADDGRPTIAQYIKKILLVSDNDAFNRLYEFLGQEYINNNLHRMGYDEVQIIHRLEIGMSEDEYRHTNPVKFFDTSDALIFEKPLEKSKLVYTIRDTKMGEGFYRGGQLIREPFDFSKKNRMSLKTLHSIVRSIVFPEAVPSRQRFNLTNDDYDFLRKYMSMLPRESGIGIYQTEDYWDNYVKFLFRGSEKKLTKDEVRIFNKVGDAYGFLVDAGYFVDFKNNIEFQLSAVIHSNSDKIFNDDKYDYDSVGFPFMKELGKVIYKHELKRQRRNAPDLSRFRFKYSW